MVFPILPANTLSGGYDIDNSVRFDGAAANGFARFGNNSRNDKTFTISFWIKRTELGAVQQLVNSKVEDSGANALIMTINSTDQLVIGGQFTTAEYETLLVTNNKLRDPSAWYHIVFRSDTTQSGATDRFKFYINGTEASYATDDRANVSQDDTWAIFYNTSSYPYAISNDERDNVYGDFYMAEHHYCDGVSNAPTEFGEVDEDSGIWKPKKYTGSHGTYGHYLEFKEAGAGSGTTAIGGHDYTTGSSSTIGADTSGNDNHFHVQGYATTDQTTDTPTNNFATWNPLIKSTNTYSEGNTLVSMDASADAKTTSTIGVSKGKWYMEFLRNDNDNWPVGIAGSSIEGAYIGGANTDSLSFWVGLASATASHTELFVNGSEVNDPWNATTWAEGDVVALLLNADDEEISLYKNNSIVGSAYDYSGLNWSQVFFALGNYISGNSYKTNFGNPCYALSSGNADANGYGNFEYAPPSGYYALCTKNLAEFG